MITVFRLKFLKWNLRNVCFIWLILLCDQSVAVPVYWNNISFLSVLHVQQIAEMQKENFSLKLRIYFLEERMKKDGIPNEDVYNIVCTMCIHLLL